MDKWRVIYYISSSGANPVSDFLDSLDRRTQSKLLRIIVNIETYGLLSVIPHVKKLSGTPLWEIRVLGKINARIIYVVPTQTRVILLHGFVKKSNKTPSKEIDIALTRFRDLTR
jgi:phage-related protein